MRTASRRNAVLTVAMATCLAAPDALAQRRSTDASAAGASTPAAIPERSTGAGPQDEGQSGFGQVMQMLTQLLQDAADKQAAAANTEAVAPVEDASNAAVRISVTPVDGRTTFYAPKAGNDHATPPRPAASPGAAQSPQLAAQADSAEADSAD